MTSVFRITSSMIIALFAAFIITGCATTPQAAKPATPPAAATESGPKKIIVAKVNDAELTMDALIQMMNRLPEKGGSTPESLEERKKRALDALVLREIAYQRAIALGLNADFGKVEITVENIKQGFQSEKEFAEFLANKNMTESDLRTDIERNLTIDLIYKTEVVEGLVIPEDEMKAKYAEEKEHFIRPEKVVVIDVFMLKNEGKASLKKAKELLKKIKADPKQDPWKLVLDGTFMVRNLTVRKDKEKELYTAAKKLKPQGLSSVIQTPTGPHIIKLKEFTSEKRLSYEEAKPGVRELLKEPYQVKRTQEWEEELRKSAKIVLLLDELEQKEQKKP